MQRKYIYRVILFFSPFILLFFAFLYFDPFSMYHYRFTSENEGLNDDFRTFQRFDAYNDSAHFNAFILGNSKTLAILSLQWKKHIGNQRVFKFASPGESLLNIRKKLEYAEKKGDSIQYAILVLDRKILHNTDNESPEFSGPVYLKGPKSSYNNSIKYCAKGFYAFLYDFYFIDYFKNFSSKKETPAKPALPKGIIEKYMSMNDFQNLRKSNEFFREDMEATIEKDTVKWISQMEKPILANSSEINIDKRDLEHLQAIKKIFSRHHTQYKIVFGPEYNAQDIGENVLREFYKIFATKDGVSIWDFSSDTTLIKPLYYYEPNHYRPLVGQKMMEKIYH